MVHYKELGLVNTKELFKKAMDGGYAIPAYNFNNLEQLQAIIQACTETEPLLRSSMRISTPSTQPVSAPAVYRTHP